MEKTSFFYDFYGLGGIRSTPMNATRAFSVDSLRRIPFLTGTIEMKIKNLIRQSPNESGAVRNRTYRFGGSYQLSLIKGRGWETAPTVLGAVISCPSSKGEVGKPHLPFWD